MVLSHSNLFMHSVHGVRQTIPMIELLYVMMTIIGSINLVFLVIFYFSHLCMFGLQEKTYIRRDNGRFSDYQRH